MSLVGEENDEYAVTGKVNCSCDCEKFEFVGLKLACYTGSYIPVIIWHGKKVWMKWDFDDYSGESDLAFKWNEFELISLEAANGDEDWTNDIRSWWKTKIPFYMSVDGEYSFYAIDTEDNGAILSGYEPEFEEADKVADSFEDFMSKVLSADTVLKILN